MKSVLQQVYKNPIISHFNADLVPSIVPHDLMLQVVRTIPEPWRWWDDIPDQPREVMESLLFEYWSDIFDSRDGALEMTK